MLIQRAGRSGRPPLTAQIQIFGLHFYKEGQLKQKNATFYCLTEYVAGRAMGLTEKMMDLGPETERLEERRRAPREHLLPWGFGTPSSVFGYGLVFCQVKSSYLYLYSAFNNTNCVKATAQYQNRKIVYL